jgi:NAD(P)-dependent dehydrogenase (short-subunit alcohol dehydrogenase family)
MRVLITGASSGIGSELARRLARRGDDVALLARGREGLEKTARAIHDAGGFAIVETADVTDRDALQGAIDRAAERLGGLDAVVANAGAAAYGLFADMDPEDVDRTFEVTLNGAVNTARAALPHLERSQGTLVVTGSVGGIHPLPMLTAYSAAKYGVRGFFEGLRLELRATGSKVRVALVHPGPVDTPFWVNVTPVDRMPPDIPPQIAQEPERIARTIIRALEQPRPERVVGVAMKALGLVPRPIRDYVLTQAVRYSLEHPGDDEPGRAIWEPAGTGDRKILAER